MSQPKDEYYELLRTFLVIKTSRVNVFKSYRCTRTDKCRFLKLQIGFVIISLNEYILCCMK